MCGRIRSLSFSIIAACATLARSRWTSMDSASTGRVDQYRHLDQIAGAIVGDPDSRTTRSLVDSLQPDRRSRRRTRRRRRSHQRPSRWRCTRLICTLCSCGPGRASGSAPGNRRRGRIRRLDRWPGISATMMSARRLDRAVDSTVAEECLVDDRWRGRRGQGRTRRSSLDDLEMKEPRKPQRKPKPSADRLPVARRSRR